jgi:O-antigen/teichoic acid export membrane protein
MGLGSLWMILATVVLNLSMVLYQRVMSDHLGDAFAELSALGAMTNVVGVLTIGASITLVKIFAEDEAEGGPGMALGRFRLLLKPLLKAMLGAGLALAALAPLAISYLKLQSPLTYALFCLSFVLGLGLLASRALVQGTQRFGFLGLSLALEGLGRVGLGALLVAFMGAGVAGALGGSMLALFAGFACCLGAMAKLGPGSEPRARHLGASLREMGADAAVLGLFSLLCYLDIFVVKHRLDELGAANYSRAALVAKSFLYLASALNMVLLPAVTAARARGGAEAAKKALFKFLAAALAMELAGLAFVWAFTPFVIQILCGGDEKFQALAPLIRVFSAAVVPLALSQLVLYYLLASREYRVLWLLGAIVALYMAFLQAVGGEVFRVVSCLALASACLLGGTLWLAGRPVAATPLGRNPAI